MSEFERWQKRFSAPEYIFGEKPNAFLANQKHLLPKAGTALSVADGEGRNGVWLAEQGLDVHAIDFSPNALEKARALAKKRGVSIRTELADVIDWTYPEQAYDVVAVIFTQFMNPDERDRVFAGVRGALKPGGLLLIEGYTPKQLEFGTGGPKQVENLYTREQLTRDFAGFSDVTISEYETEMDEGSAHGGMSAVIDFTGRKPTS
jgi:SAM-dependent methyltransferase